MNAQQWVRLERHGAVARVVLARPDSGNAVSLGFCRDLQEAVETCSCDPSIRAVLLKAEGSAFCVGGDLGEFERAGRGRPSHLAELAPKFHTAQAILMTMRAPIVVAIQGVAAGAGLSLAMCGDLVIAADSALFTLAYTAIGLSPDGGSTHLLPRLVGLRRTQELMLTNRRLTATEALAWGMVTEVVADNDLAARTEALAQRLAEGPTAAYGAVKRLLSLSFDRDFKTQTDDEAREITRLSGEPDAFEGISAFFAKRRPAFGGLTP